MPSILAYWPGRGVTNQIRMLLHYVGEDFEDKFYTPSEDLANIRVNFFKEKYSLGLPLPNLPYYIDGDIKITQSLAIERYLSRKYKLEATTEEGRIRQDNLLYLAVDIQTKTTRLCYGSDFETAKLGHVEWLKEVCQQLSSLLGEADYFIGEKLNFADFHLCEGLSMNTVIDSSYLEEFPNLQAFVQRIENLPRVKEFLASPKFVKGALVGPGASFGYIPYKPKQ